MIEFILKINQPLNFWGKTVSDKTRMGNVV